MPLSINDLIEEGILKSKPKPLAKLKEPVGTFSFLGLLDDFMLNHNAQETAIGIRVALITIFPGDTVLALRFLESKGYHRQSCSGNHAIVLGFDNVGEATTFIKECPVEARIYQNGFFIKSNRSLK